MQSKTLKIGLELSAKQLRIMHSEHEINIVFAGRGSGKTAITSIIAITHLLQGRNVMIIAPTFRQLSEQNFTEIVRFIHIMKLENIVSYKQLSISYGDCKIRFLTGMVPERLRGYSSIHTIIFDETANLMHDCYKLAIATQRDLKGLMPQIFIVGTPPPNDDHWVAQMALGREDIFIATATARENPFIEKDYLDKMENEYKWLPDDFKRRELYGELVFTGASDVSLFNDFRIEQGSFDYPDEPIIAGLDIAGRGSDMTVMVIKKGKQVLDIIIEKTPNDDKLKDFVKRMHEAWNFDVLRFDSTGFGHLITFDLPVEVLVNAVDFSVGAGERFSNQRTLIYAMLAKERIIYMNGNAFAKHGESILKELHETRYNLARNARKLILIDKKLIKERLGYSPDRSDALALAFSHPPQKKEAKAILAPTIFNKFSKGLK